jgi:hypothetical protein
MDLHSSYRQTTVFDQLWLALLRGLRHTTRLQGRRTWGWTFGLLALLFGVIGAAFLLNALDPGPGQSALASLGSALLALGVFRHFARCALPLLRPHGARRPAPQARAVVRRRSPALEVAPAAASRAKVVAQPRERPAPSPSAAERRAYLAGLRAAGVNIRSARALVSAGYLSGTALQHASDTEILAIRGVGPATLKKIRACFRAHTPA